jgi:hypothetical protein
MQCGTKAVKDQVQTFETLKRSVAISPSVDLEFALPVVP